MHTVYTYLKIIYDIFILYLLLFYHNISRLSFIILYYINYIILFCIILYYSILYYIILHYFTPPQNSTKPSSSPCSVTGVDPMMAPVSSEAAVRSRTMETTLQQTFTTGLKHRPPPTNPPEVLLAEDAASSKRSDNLFFFFPF